MALATLGGSLVHGNASFRNMTDYNCQDEQDAKEFSIFNLTARDDLSFAFEKLNGLLLQGSDGKSPNGTIQLRSCYPGFQLHISSLPSSQPSASQLDGGHRLLVTLLPSVPVAPGSTGGDDAMR